MRAWFQQQKRTLLRQIGWLGLLSLLLLTGCPNTSPQEPSLEPVGKESTQEPPSPTEKRNDGGTNDTQPEVTPEPTPLPAATLLIEDGDRQRGEILQPLLKPLTVRYINRDGEPVANVKVEFTIILGGGTLDNKATKVTKETDTNGRVSVIWTGGSTQGYQRQRVEAQVQGSSDMPITFVASFFRAGRPEDTSFAGVVLNNQAQPLAGVDVYLVNNNQKSKTVKTNKSGTFVLTGLTNFVGQAHLVVDGSKEPSQDVYPRLEYEVFNIAGMENRLDGPIPLPRLDPTGTTTIEAGKTAVVKPTSMPGLQMIIAAGSATFPDKKTSGTVNITKVDPYWIPMPIPNGYASTMVVTIQPPDVRFDPPAPITFPNNDQLPAGSKAPIFSFDHAKGRYVKIADGIVSSDGKTITSMPGQGIVKGGWHTAGRLLISRQRTAVAGGRENGSPNRRGKAGSKQGHGKSSKSADPISLHNGGFSISKRDLYLPGRGIEFEFVRTYNSRFQYNGPMGFNWDHNYNIRLEILDNEDVILRNGHGREDTFTKTNNSYTSPPHLFSTLTKLQNENYSLKSPDGQVHIFDKHGFLQAIQDRFGNKLTFEYNHYGQLITIIDTLGRPIRLRYTRQGRISSLSDHTGRTVTYQYDNQFDLVSVTSPATQQYPKGITVKYTYSQGQSTAILNHNLLTATNGRGETYLTNRYDSEDRVVEQIYGPGTYKFAYQDTNPKADPKDLAVVRSITTETDPERNVTKHHFNVNGNEVKTERMSRGLQSNSPKAWVRTTSFNEDGLATKIVYPNGNSVEYTYDSNNTDRKARKNLLQQKRISHLPNDKHKELLTTYTYETTYNFIKTQTEPRGNCSGCNKARYTTTFTYDNLGRLTQITYPEATLPDQSKQKRIRKQKFNVHGQLIEATDAMGIVTQYEYYPSNGNPEDFSDQEGYLKQKVFDANGLKLVTSYSYDALGNIVSITDPNKHTTRFVYNARNQKILEISPAPFHYKTYYRYDKNDNEMERRTENVGPDGKLDLSHPFLHLRMEYNTLDKVTKLHKEVTPGNFLTTEFVYDKKMRQVAKVMPEGNRIAYTYDERNLMLSLTRGAGSAEAATYRYEYDPNGNLIKETKPEGEEYTRDYDGFNRMVRSKDPVNSSEEMEYDRSHNRIAIRGYGDSEGKSNVLLSESRFFFDEANRMVKQEVYNYSKPGAKPTKLTSLFTFDANNGLVRSVDPKGDETRQEFDSAHRRSAAIDAAGNRVEHTFDNNSNILTSKVTAKSTVQGVADKIYITRYTYDSINRKVTTTDPLNQTTRYAYDSRGNLRTSTDAEGEVTEYTYDGVNRSLQVTTIMRTNGKETSRVKSKKTWDKNSRVIAMIDDNNNQHTYRYDSHDRLLEINYPTPQGGTAPVYRWQYDKNGRVTTHIDANGTRTTHTYDKAGRLLRKNMQRAKGVLGETFRQFRYDGLDRIVEATNNNSKITLTYDSLGRALTETQNGKTVTSTYDAGNNRTSLRYPGSLQLQYSYDKLDRMTQMKLSQAKSPLVTYGYLGGERRIEKSFANGIKLRCNLDAGGRIAEHAFRTATSKLVVGFGYRYNKANQRLYKKYLHESNKGDVYQYDSLYRVTQTKYGVADPDKEVTQPGSQQATKQTNFKLDGVANRVTVQDDTTPITYQLNALNQYTKVGTTNYTYDTNGNRLDDGTKLYAYNFENKLIRVTDKATQKVLATYQYDALGRRIKSQTGGATTRFVYDGSRVIEERDAQDKIVVSYIHGAGVDERIAMVRGTKTYTYHHNALGSVVAISNESGALVERYRYDVFGKTTILDTQGKARTTSSVGNLYRYTGRRYDPESGLYYYRARHYDTAIGKFLQRDPKGLSDGLNLYAYVGHNPVMYKDPMGTRRKRGGWRAWARRKLRSARIASGRASRFVRRQTRRAWRGTKRVGKATVDFSKKVTVAAVDFAGEEVTFGLWEPGLGKKFGYQDSWVYKGTKYGLTAGSLVVGAGALAKGGKALVKGGKALLKKNKGKVVSRLRDTTDEAVDLAKLRKLDDSAEVRNVVDEAAKASGLDAKKLVDKVTRSGANSSSFTVDPKTGQRILDLGEDAFRSKQGKLFDAAHELGHAEDYANTVRRHGGDTKKALKEFNNPSKKDYALDEVLVENRSHNRVANYLKGKGVRVESKEIVLSHQYRTTWAGKYKKYKGIATPKK